jgi:N-acetyltransferase
MVSSIQFNFKENFILENDLVRLEPLSSEHIQKLERFVGEYPYIWQYSYMHITSTDDLQVYLNHALEQRKLGVEYAFAVYDKLKNEYAGSTRFYDIQLKNATTQLGYTWYGKNFRGTYVNKNCKLLLLKFAFDQIGFHRVEFRADSENEKSIAAMKKIGCVVEGILRENLPRPSGNRRSSIILSILNSEWKNGLDKQLAASAELLTNK